jgi:hypothetical protein
MSGDYQPKMIFGLKIHKSKVIDTSDIFVNYCKCDPKIDPSLHPNVKYCPHCGSPIRSLSPKEIPKFEGFDDVFNNELLNIEVWPVTFDTDAHNFYIGFYVQKGHYGHSGDSKHDLPDMSKMEQFKTDMKRIGFWDEEMFGAWLVLYLSY